MANHSKRGQSEQAPAVEQVERLERDLVPLRKQIAKQLQRRRRLSGLSLREVGRMVGLSAAAVHSAEKGKSWETGTIKKLMQCYDEHDAQQAAATQLAA